ncbi:MAG TPA: hypothetical protein VGP94_07950 [Tepidisphaeraceae bacterium]|nr:hypothetical protein [Tepidisphaeraceae bacterium]
MAVANMELLKRAMEREAPAIITAGDGPARRQLMIQFAGADQKTPEGIWAHFHDQDAPLVQRLIDAKNPVGIWFQSDASMVQFSAPLLKKRHSLTRHLVLVERPTSISIVEERHQPRWLVPVSFSLSAKVQVLAPNRDVEFETPAQVWDLGMEGASLICPTNRRLIGMVKDAWLKVILHKWGQDNAYAALYRHISPASDKTLRLGVQFIPSGDPAAASAHDALVRLVDALDKLCAGKGQTKPASNAA